MIAKSALPIVVALLCAGGVSAAPQAPIWQDDAQTPDGLHGVSRPAADFTVTLQRPPANGAEFSFLLTDATQTGPQAAVFLNGMLQGLIQLWGTAPAPLPYKWRKTYRLYLPPGAFKAGDNTLSVRLVPPMWSDPTPEVMGRFWFKWENLRIDALDAAPREPVHGKLFWLGTTFKKNTGFEVDDRSLALIDAAFPWIGASYCGNTMRADFWHDVSRVQIKRREYLEKLRDYNATVLADYISGHFHVDNTGELDAAGKAALDKFFADYGDLIQFYELGNEPSMFGGAYADYLATARHVYANRPAHLLLAATGWAYGGGKGEPVNWEADPARRRTIESWCDMINGHSYGSSYNDARGGSFFETFKTYGQPGDGWPKPFIVSETGANDWHSEENGPRYPSRAPHTSAFDRILRAHVAVVDRAIQHALIFDDFGLFETPANPDDMKGSLRVRTPHDGEPSRLSVFRRIALAYATHGAPLETEILNPAELKNRLLLVRAVDTLAIAPQAGSLAKSDKILVALVNFEDQPQRISVRVKMPVAGHYSALRIDNGMDYAAAHKDMGLLAANPSLVFTDTLAPGEAVEYILSTQAPRAAPAAWNIVEPLPRHVHEDLPAPPLAAPSGLRAFGLGKRIVLDYVETQGAVMYQLERSQNGGAFTPIGNWSGALSAIDSNVTPGSRYAYHVRARDEAQTGPFSEPVSLALEKGIPPAGWQDAGIGSNGDAGASLSTADGSLIEVTGAGHDIWADKDGLRFLYKTVPGDATLVARVLHYDQTHSHAKAGLMIRASLDEGAPMALVAQMQQGSVFNWRQLPGGPCGQTGAPRNAWLKLERRGNRVTGYASPDGTLWIKAGTAELPEGQPLLFGLAVCSHTAKTTTALFDNISLAP